MTAMPFLTMSKKKDTALSGSFRTSSKYLQAHQPPNTHYQRNRLPANQVIMKTQDAALQNNQHASPEILGVGNNETDPDREAGKGL